MEQRSYPFSWEPGWSYSRMNTLRSCLRLYWYEYYAKRFASQQEKGRIMELQQLSRLPFEVGNAVHETVADVLKELQSFGRVLDPDVAREMALKRFDILTASKPMVERRLGLWPSAEDIDRMRGDIGTSITTFYNSRWLTMLQEIPSDARKGWHIDPPGYGEFRIEGKKAYAKPDLVFGYTDGRNYLVEWKSGKPHREENRTQVLAYMFYAKDIMGLDLDSTVGVVQYLTHPEEEPLEVEGGSVDTDGVKRKILDEIRLIESKCEDVATNTPRPIGQFPKAAELGYCELCKYREICKPDFEKKSK